MAPDVNSGKSEKFNLTADSMTRKTGASAKTRQRKGARRDRDGMAMVTRAQAGMRGRAVMERDRPRGIITAVSGVCNAR